MHWQAQDKDAMGRERQGLRVLLTLFHVGSQLLCLGIGPALAGDWIKAICMSVFRTLSFVYPYKTRRKSMQSCRELNSGGGGEGKEDRLLAFNQVQILLPIKYDKDIFRKYTSVFSCFKR